MDVNIINGNIIHNLINDYYRYIKSIDDSIKQMFPNLVNDYKLQILPKYIFLKKSPIMFGVKVLSGRLCSNTIISAQIDTKNIKLGTIISIQKNNTAIISATKDDEVCIKIDEGSGEKYEYGKHFNEEWILLPYVNETELQIRNKYPNIFS
jgi:translation initiation factor IF-2